MMLRNMVPEVMFCLLVFLHSISLFRTLSVFPGKTILHRVHMLCLLVLLQLAVLV